MKITRVEPIHLRLPDVNERCDGSQETLVVQVHTDAGLVGGGFRKSFRAYASILFGDTPAETERIGRDLAGQGYRAVKFGWGPMGQSEESDLAHVRAARQGVGPDVELMVDAGLCWDASTAV